MKSALIAVALFCAGTLLPAQQEHALQIKNGESYHVINAEAGPAGTTINTIPSGTGWVAKTPAKISAGQVFLGMANGMLQQVSLTKDQILVGKDDGTGAEVRKLVAGDNVNFTKNANGELVVNSTAQGPGYDGGLLKFDVENIDANSFVEKGNTGRWQIKLTEGSYFRITALPAGWGNNDAVDEIVDFSMLGDYGEGSLILIEVDLLNDNVVFRGDGTVSAPPVGSVPNTPGGDATDYAICKVSSNNISFDHNDIIIFVRGNGGWLQVSFNKN